MIKGYSAISTSLWHHVASSNHWKGYHEAFPVVNINPRSKLGIRSNLFTTPFLREGHVLVWTTVGGELGYVLLLKLFSPLFINQKTWRSNLTSDMSLGHQNYSKFWISEVVLCQQWGPATGKTHAEKTPSVFPYCIHFALGFSSELKNEQNAAIGRSGYICCHAEDIGGLKLHGRIWVPSIA